jgi:hypothetical protein
MIDIWEVKPYSKYGQANAVKDLAKYLIEALAIRKTGVRAGYWLPPLMSPNIRRPNEIVVSWSGTGAEQGVRWYRSFVPPPPVRVQVPERERDPQPNKVNVPVTVAQGVGIGAAGYLLYRAARMLPSFLPPMWGTIFPNLVLP